MMMPKQPGNLLVAYCCLLAPFAMKAPYVLLFSIKETIMFLFLEKQLIYLPR
jgi:hypothetical protein